MGDFVKDMAKSGQISVAEVEKNFFRDLRPGSLIQHFASIDEIASLVVYIASPLASATNGAALRADGVVTIYFVDGLKIDLCCTVSERRMELVDK